MRSKKIRYAVESSTKHGWWVTTGWCDNLKEALAKSDNLVPKLDPNRAKILKETTVLEDYPYAQASTLQGQA